jgi:trigger factor
MPNKRIHSFLALALSALVSFAGCSADDGSETSPSPSGSAEESAFSYSDGIDDKGFWDGITATDYVVLPQDYAAIRVAAEDWQVTEAEIDAEVESALASYQTESQVTDRAVVDGDTVNIDYVGSVGGVEFDNGSTAGAGTDVTIGETQYIDDFLQQIIGHSPGETFDVEVTFPEDYGVEALNGQDAVFVTTVNYISQTVTPELTDAFVAENLKATDGWSTVQEMRDGLADDLKRSALQTVCTEYLLENSIVDKVPDAIAEYMVNALVSYYQRYADSYGMELDEFLSTNVGFESTEALISGNEETNLRNAEYSLIMQAVAEKQKISCTDDDIDAHFAEYSPDQDMAEVESIYGKPYVTQIVLQQKVTDFLTGNAVLE